MARITISVIKADVGSLAGHHIVLDQLIESAETSLLEAKKKGDSIDFYVTAVRDDLQLIMSWNGVPKWSTPRCQRYWRS